MTSVPSHAPPPPRSRDRGQAILEFALVLPVLLLLTVGIVDLARVYAANISLTNAVREGALYAGQRSYDKWCSASGAIPCPDGTVAANQEADPDNITYRMALEAVGMNPADIVVAQPECTTDSNATFAEGTVVVCSTADDALKFVRLTATYDVPLLTPVLADLLGGSVPITASTVAPIVAS